MPPETPLAFGLHPNAEIGFKLREAERFCANVLCLQPREAGGEGGMSVEEKAKMVGTATQSCSRASCRLPATSFIKRKAPMLTVSKCLSTWTLSLRAENTGKYSCQLGLLRWGNHQKCM